MKLLSLIWLFLAINLSMMLFSYGSYSTQNCNGTVLAGGQCYYNDSQTQLNPGLGNYSHLNYYGGNASTSTSTNELGQNYTTSESYTSDSVMGYFFESFSGRGAKFYMYLIGFAVLIGALGFIPFVNRSDISVLAGPFILLVGAGLPTIVSIYSFINSESGAYACPILGQGCFVSEFLGVIIAGVLGFAWIAANLEFWLGRPTS
jgi:hypothetical protein